MIGFPKNRALPLTEAGRLWTVDLLATDWLPTVNVNGAYP